MQRSMRLLALVLSIGLLLASWPVNGYAQPLADDPVVQPDFGASSIAWNAPQGSGSFILVVSGPDGYRFEQTFQSGVPLAFQAVDATGAALADGLYQYDLTPVRYDLTKARSVGNDGRNPAETRELVQSQANVNTSLAAISGAFTIQNGAILDPNAVEEETAVAAQPQQSDSPTGIDAPADVVHPDDVIIQGSACVGFDCVNGENFGFDTLRLKENNLRLHFDDTSSSGSFPKNDWRIVANDSSNGGANYLAIEDTTAGTTPFRVLAGAGNNALYVDAQGDVGLNTSTPVVELHISDGDSPTVRLEQSGASGFTPQTWDLAGNEAGFFVRDVTNGSKLPFRIKPNTPDEALFLYSGEVVINEKSNNYDTRIEGDNEQNLLFVDASADKVGIGTNAPTASLHVKRSDGTAKILVEETSGTAADRTLLELKNNGKAQLILNDTRDTKVVTMVGNRGNLIFSLDGTNRLTQSATDGSVTIVGNLTLSGGSCTGCRTSTTIWSMPQAELLNQLSGVPIVRWDGTAFDLSASSDGSSNAEVAVAHISPNMQAFYDSFDLGLNGQQIAPLDVATVSLASVQALNETIQQQQQLIEAQAAQLAALETRLLRVEAMAHAHSYLPSVSR